MKGRVSVKSMWVLETKHSLSRCRASRVNIRQSLANALGDKKRQKYIFKKDGAEIIADLTTTLRGLKIALGCHIDASYPSVPAAAAPEVPLIPVGQPQVEDDPVG